MEERRSAELFVIISIFAIGVLYFFVVRDFIGPKVTLVTLETLDTTARSPAFWDEQRQKVETAKKADAAYKKAYADMEQFCGKGNVWDGSGEGADRVFGCMDYLRVELKK